MGKRDDLNRIIEKIKEKIANSRGIRTLLERSPGSTRKDRRHSGRYTPRIQDRKAKYSEIYEEALNPEEAYDDWDNYRDGVRYGKYEDFTKKKPLWVFRFSLQKHKAINTNKRIRIQTQRRIAMRTSKEIIQLGNFDF